MTAAAIVTECLVAHAQQVFSGSDKKTGDAQYLLRRLGEMGREFGKQELWQKVKRRFQSASSFDDALQALEDNGYIRIESIPTDGRPMVKILVNPVLSED